MTAHRTARPYTRMPAPAADRPAGDGGFSLVEVLVALGLISIVMGALSTFFVGSTATINRQSEYQTAAQLATDRMERIRAIEGVAEVAGGTDTPERDGIGYDVTWSVRRCWLRTTAPNSTCADGDTQPAQPANAVWADYLRVGVTVAWADKNCSGGTCTYRTGTLISRAELEPVFNTGGA